MDDMDLSWRELASCWDSHDFGAAHDWLGERWNHLIQTRPGGHDDPDARFLQGVAFTALAFHFTRNRNQEGARLLLDDALEVLRDYLPSHRGLRVAPMLESLRALQPLLAGIAPDAPCPMEPFSCRPLVYEDTP